jgi:NADPH2:quinone reductase
MAVAAGCTVFATGGSEKGRRLLTDQGANRAFDHHMPDYLSQLKDLTGGHGVNVILEMLANVNLANDLSVLAPGGRIVVIGNRGSIEINPRDLMLQESSVSGVMLSRATETEMKSIHAAIGSGLKSGTLNPIIGHEMPLSEAIQAHLMIIGQQAGAYGKIVLVA